MSLTKEDLDLFTKSFQCFSKLLILYPMLHPAAIHGLLVEFNYDYGFVMQLILKLESQRNALYWDEVARASNRMEQRNRTKMNFYTDINSANQRLTEMLGNQMSLAINSFGERAANNLHLSPLMEDSDPNSEPGKVVAESLGNTNLLPLLAKISAKDLNEIMQMSRANTNSQQKDKILEKDIPAPTCNDYSLEEVQIPVTQTNANSNSTTSLRKGAVILENKIYGLPTALNNWPINEIEKYPQSSLSHTNSNPNNIFIRKTRSRNMENKLFKAPKVTKTKFHITEIPNNRTRVVQTFSTSNFGSPMTTNQNHQSIHSNPSAMKDCIVKKPNIPFQSNSNNYNAASTRKTENQINFVQSLPQTPNDTIKKQDENLQSSRPQLCSTNYPAMEANIKWRTTIIGEDSFPPRIVASTPKKKTTNKLREFRKPKKILPKLSGTGIVINDQKELLTSTSNSANIYLTRLREIKNKSIQPKLQYFNTNVNTSGIATHNGTQCKIIEIKAPPNILSGNSQSSTFQLVEIPNLQNTTFNITSNFSGTINTETMINALNQIKSNQLQLETVNTNWQISGIAEHPKIQMVLSRSEFTGNLSSSDVLETQISDPAAYNTKAVPATRGRKHKLKINKTITEAKVSEVANIQTKKPAKRRMKNNKSNLPKKKTRLESTSIPPNSKLALNELKVDSSVQSHTANEIIIKENDQVLQRVTKKTNNKKEQQKRKKRQTRLTLKRTTKKRKVKAEDPEPSNIGLRNNKEKKKSNKQNKTRAKSKIIKEIEVKQEHDVNKSEINSVPNKKKRGIRKPQTKRNKNKMQNNASDSEDYDMSSGTNFLKIDPHITKIEIIPGGELITVCPKLRNCKGFNSGPKIQFIRRYPNTRHQMKKEHSKSKKSEIENKTKKEQAKSRTLSNKIESQICNITEKPKRQINKPLPKHQTDKSKTETFKSTVKKPKGKKSKKKTDNNDPHKPATKESIKGKAPKGSISCCCQSIGFRKKYKLPPFDKEEDIDLYPDEILLPKKKSKPKKTSPLGQNIDTPSSYEKIPKPNMEADKNTKEKNKKMAQKKTSAKRLYNTRSNKNKNEN